jgi:phage terminase small subunit
LIARYGYWEKTEDPKTGKVKVDRFPWTFEEPKAWEQFARAGACLGLDPTSRARLKAEIKPEADGLADLLARRKAK